MDLNDLRSLLALAGLVVFVAIAAWTWLPARRAGLGQAAQLPFEGDAGVGAPGMLGARGAANAQGAANE